MKATFLDIDGLDDLDLSPIQQQVNELVTYGYTAAEDVAEYLKDSHIAITNKALITREVIEALPNLKLICVAATGINNIDLTAARERNIPIVNCQAYGATSVAQHTITLLLALHTQLIPYQRDVDAGKWQQSRMFCMLNHPIVEAEGRTLGIVGYGNLGQAVARKAEALGMKVMIAARLGTEPDASTDKGRTPLNELLTQVDILSLHCPLNDNTLNLIDTPEIALMKRGSFIINTARGGIVNEQAVVDALRSGQLGGAAFDTLTQEPPNNDNPLLQPNIPNLIVTPHNAWGSKQARTKIVEQIGENIAGFKADNLIRHVK